MLMERELTINKFVCGRWFLSLIALLLMSVGMQAEDYNLWVAGTQVTSDNSSDVLGDGKVSWNNSSNTLTLNGATVNGTIVSDNDLIVHLIGRNVIHNSDAAFQIGGNNDLSFTAVRGATLFTDATSDEDFAYSVGNQSGIELDYYDLPNGDDYSYKLSYDAELKRCLGEYYGIDIYAFTNGASSLGPQNITAANCDKLAGYYDETTETWDNSVVTLTYDKSTNTLTMNNMNLESAMDNYLFRILEEQAKNLTIYMLGDNKLRQFPGEYGSGFVTNDYYDGKIIITTNPEAPGSLTSVDLYTDDEYTSFVNGTHEYRNGLEYSYVGDGIRYIRKAPESLGLKVAGTVVTAGNAANVLGDAMQSVSYDSTNHILTLRGANFGSNDGSPIVVDEEISALTLHLIGNSCIYSSEEDPIISFANANPSLTVTTSEKLPGSMNALNLSTVEPTLLNGLTFKEGTISASLANTEVSLFTGKSLYVNTDNAEDNSYIYSSPDFYASYATAEDGGAFVKVSTREGDAMATMWPCSLNYPELQKKVTIQLGALSADDVTVQVVGWGQEYDDDGYPTGTFVADGNTYSDAIDLSTADADGIIEIPLTSAVTSESLQLVFSSSSSFSFMPISIAFTTYSVYDITIGHVAVTENNASNITGEGITGTVSYDDETHTLTLDNATIGNDGSDDEPMEACGIDYTGTADLTICLKGTNTIYGMGGCEAIRYNGYGDAAPKLRFTKGDNQTCSLQLNTNTDYERTAISGGFSEIEGVWGVGTTDNGLAIIADNEVKYDSEEGLTIKQVVNYIANYVPLSSTQIASYYGLTISGVPVYEGNKGNITGEGIYGDGTASFEPRTNTLTLNNVNLNPDYAQNDGDLRVSIVTSLAQLNINLIGESQTYAIKTTNENSTLTFKSAEENRGAARLNFWYNADPYFIGFGEDKVTYNDGLCMREDSYNSSFPMIVALNVPKVITNEKERGLYFPDHVFTFALEEEIEGFDIYYANMLGGDPVKTTDGTFSLGTGRYVLNVYPIYPGMDTDPGRNWQYSSEIYAKVIEKPTFSVDASSVYNDDITVFLQNIPEQGTTSVWDDNLQENIEMPQVWYYIDDNKTDSVRYDATKGIPVTESCKVSAYILDEDSGRVVKSIPVEAEYTVISKTQLNISYAQNSREWASYCASENSLETPDGLQAYVVKQATKTGVQVEAIDYIPQGVGVLLKRTAEVAEPIVAKAYIGNEPETPANKLVGTTTSTSVKTLTGSVYVLYNDGFTRATSGSIGANRGYLLFDETVAAGARLSIFEDETTAVENVNRETLTNNQYYNLNGQRVVAPKKNGLYIVNGQKKIVK